MTCSHPVDDFRACSICERHRWLIVQGRCVCAGPPWAAHDSDCPKFVRQDVATLLVDVLPDPPHLKTEEGVALAWTAAGDPNDLRKGVCHGKEGCNHLHL